MKLLRKHKKIMQTNKKNAFNRAFPFSFFSKPSKKSQRKEEVKLGEWKEMSEESLTEVAGGSLGGTGGAGAWTGINGG